jgi:hypothetical protein
MNETVDTDSEKNKRMKMMEETEAELLHYKNLRLIEEEKLRLIRIA